MKAINFDKIFSSLLSEMNATKASFQAISNWNHDYENLKIELQKPEGIEVDISDLEILENGLFSYKGHTVLVYIRDQYTQYNNQYKFHLTDCSTIDSFRMQRRFNKRYVATQNTSGNFIITIPDSNNPDRRVKETAEMKVCKNCLKRMNYKNYNNANNYEKNRIYSDFSIESFLDEYETKFNELPKYNENTMPINNYTENWDKISKKYRESQNYVCESCGKSFEFQKDSLHTHHIDGDKTNNSPGNLMALCKWCHSRQPGHEHMKIK